MKNTWQLISSILLVIVSILLVYTTSKMDDVEEENLKLKEDLETANGLVFEYENNTTELIELVDSYKKYIEELKSEHTEIQERLKENMPK